MRSQRIFGLLMVCVEAATLGFLSRSVVFPIAVSIAALIGVVSSIRLALNRKRVITLVLVLAILFFLKYLLFPENPHYSWGFFRFQALLVLAQYMLVLQAVAFYLEREDDSLPAMLPGLGVVVMVCVSVVRITAHQRIILQGLSTCFAVLLAFYCGACRQPLASPKRRTWKSFASISVLVVASTTAWIFAAVWYQYERKIDNFLAHFTKGNPTQVSVGFSGSAELDGVQRLKNLSSNRIAVRILCDDDPGYLRGEAFDRFDYNRWTKMSGQLSLDPTEEVPNDVPRPQPTDQLFTFLRGTSADWQRMECWPDQAFGTHLFTPLGTTRLTAAVEEVSVDPYGIFKSDQLPPGHPYTALVPQPHLFKSKDDLNIEQLTYLPPLIHPGIRQLADRLFADCKTSSDRVDAVERYFHDSYRYSQSIEIPTGMAPLAYFLLERPAAHCEFFASGAAVLLRLGKVPCRYVTGFVPSERNRYGNYWVTRNRDAHAWIEAYVDDVGWIIVESTPSAGIPARTEPSNARQLGEWVRDRAYMIRVTLQQGSLRAAADMCRDLLFRAPVFTLMAAVAVIIVFRRWVKLRRKRPIVTDPRLKGFHRLLDHMDAQLRKQKVERRLAETLNQFADRIQSKQIANWYRRYAMFRYTGRIDTQSVQELRELATRCRY